jgi:hypothetical protein
MHCGFVRSIFLVVILATSAAAESSEGIPILTVCEALNNIPEYQGKTVVIVGAVKATSEGAWLDEHCPGSLTIEGRSWPYSISAAYARGENDPPPPLPQGFRWDKIALRKKLSEVKSTTKLEVLPQYHYSDTWAAIYGRFEAQPQHFTIYGDLEVGYGHMSGAPAQLIWPRGGWHQLK